MPHDSKGKEVKAGDVVTMKFVVKDVLANEENCNANIEATEPMESGYAQYLTANTKQLTILE